MQKTYKQKYSVHQFKRVKNSSDKERKEHTDKYVNSENHFLYKSRHFLNNEFL